MNERINFLLKQIAVPSDKWEYKGMTLFVLHNDFNIPKSSLPFQVSQLLIDGVWNGYVLTDIYIPLESLEDIEVHGGITLHGYSEQNIYGFDTAHSDDFDTPKSKTWVMEETRKLADAILAWHPTPADGNQESE